MKPILVLMAALITTLVTPALAQPKGPDDMRPLTEAMLLQIDMMPVDRMCSARGAYQYAFGSTELPPSIFPFPGMDMRPLPASAAPFVEAAFSSTKWSNRFFMADYHLYLASKEDAVVAIERLARHFRARGWVERPGGVEEDGPIYDFPPGEGDVAFYSEGEPTGTHRTGVRADIGHLGGWVTFSCVSMPLMIDQVGEAFGNLPEGTPRPVAPGIVPPDALDPALCTTPEGMARVGGIMGEGYQSRMSYLMARSNHRERLVTWKTDRLKKAGVSDDRILDITMAVMQGPGDPMRNLSVLPELFDQLVAIERLEKADDRPGACRATVALLKQMDSLWVVVNRQWDAIDTALDAEAKRNGVSLN